MTMAGVVDSIKFPNTVTGWAYAHEDPGASVEIFATKNGVLIPGNFHWGYQREFHWLNDGKIGYAFTAEEALSPELIASGALQFFAQTLDHGSTELALDDGNSRFLRTIEAFKSGDIPAGFSVKDFSEVVGWIMASGIDLDASWYKKFITAIDYGGRGVGKLTDISDREMSLIPVPAGITSIDRSSVIVPCGHAVLGGSKYLLEIYAPSDETRQAAVRWIEVIKGRQVAVGDDIRYVHCIVPEKLSSFRTLFDFEIPAKSQTAELIEDHFHRLGSKYYLSVFNILNIGFEFWRTFDTHLSARGAFLMVSKILETLDLPAQSKPSFDKRVYSIGDLSTRFFDFPVYDTDMHPADDLPIPILVFKRGTTEAGDHIGIQAQWKNESAPIKKKLFVAGDSFCGHGETASDLNWWFSRYFQDVFFDFNPALDITLMQSFGPDVVVTQTTERFLKSVPRA